MKWLLGYAAALCLLVLIICTSIVLPTFFLPFYSSQYKKNETAEKIFISGEELTAVTKHLLGYMNGRLDDLVVYANIGGEEREFFNQREKDHMEDVRDLFAICFKTRNIAFYLLMFIILLMAFLRLKVLQLLSQCGREVVTGFLILAAVLVVIVAVDFDRAFNVFHLLFFNNDLWKLDPAKDLLINIVPIEFFMSIASLIGGLILFFSAVVITGGTFYLRKFKPFC